MNDATQRTRLAYFVAMFVLLVAALAGFWDILWRGDGLAPQFTLWAVVLWMGLAIPIALLGGMIAFAAETVLGRRSSPELLTTSATALIVNIALLAGVHESFLGAELALGLAVVGTLGLLAAASAPYDLRPIGRRVSIAIAVVLLLAACAPLLRGIVPRTAQAIVLLGAVAATLAFARPAQIVRRAANIALVAVLAISPLIAISHASSVAGSIQPAAPSSRPHVVLIVLDTQRADFIGAYGHPGELTPNLDELAASGTVFEDCFTTANWTIPSHASLFTGLYPQTHGASYEHHRYLDDHFETLAESLAASGYETAAFVANAYVKLANLDQGFAHYEDLGAGYKRLKLRDMLERVGLPGRFVDHGVMDGVDRVARHLRGRDSSDARPLFLFVNLLEPHWRHFPPLRDRLAVLGAADTITATNEAVSFYGPTSLARGDTDETLRHSIRGLYAAAVRHQDREFARLLEAIDAALPRDNTLLIVTNDHGENLGEAARWGHSFAINDHLVHAPLIVRHPDFAAGSRQKGLCSLVDVPATVADVVGGLEIKGAADARSLVPSRFVAREHVFAAGDPYLGHFERMGDTVGLEHDSVRWNVSLRSARSERFKYLESSAGQAVLYDLQADPDEANDVGDLHPEHVAALRSALHAWESDLPPYSAESRDGDADSRTLDAEGMARLRSLGYAN